MSKLTQEDISRLEAKGITIGAAVECAYRPHRKEPIIIESWDDFMSKQNYIMSSGYVSNFNDGGPCKLWLYDGDSGKYATVIKPAFSIDWSKSPEWAKAHVFNSIGEGYYTQSIYPSSSESEWYNCETVEMSYLTKPTDLDWKDSLMVRPEAIKPGPSIDELIEQKRKELAELEERRAKSTPVSIEDVCIVAIDSDCFVFDHRAYRMESSNTEEKTYLTFYKK